MKNADNIDAVLKRKIEDQVIPYRLATQIRFKLLATDAQLWKIGQCQTAFLDTIKKSVGVVGTVLRNKPPDFFKVAFGFRSLSIDATPGFHPFVCCEASRLRPADLMSSIFNGVATPLLIPF